MYLRLNINFKNLSEEEMQEFSNNFYLNHKDKIQNMGAEIRTDTFKR